ncbi:MAG TPA: hypothetical protein VGI60_09760 [Chthoniobacterales bacterium]|jgi:MYXO-CTERM domain-containing protein
MKTRLSRHQSATVSHSRWLAYATATTATTLAGSHSLEADIHYSGRLDVPFQCQQESCRTSHTFQLDKPGNLFVLTHYVNSYHHGFDGFGITGIVSAAVRGRSGFIGIPYISRLSSGQRISSGRFSVRGGYLEAFGRCKQWTNAGYGFVGFKFNNGAGVQYGWARIRMTGFETKDSIYKLVDYAYADPGEPLRAGQESSDDHAPDQGSLGWLALGAVGLLAWRNRRSPLAGSKDV